MHQAPSIVTPGTQPVVDEPVSRRRRRGILALLLGLTTISLGAGAYSLAIFTDSDTTEGTFASGTIDITSSPDFDLSVPALFPGDTATAELTIDNDGTGEFRYAMTADAADALGNALELTVRAEGTDCATFDGALVSGPTILDDAAFGDPSTGADAGDRVLAAGASEVLCFRVELPLAAGNALQDQTSTATFTFDAEQTANN